MNVLDDFISTPAGAQLKVTFGAASIAAGLAQKSLPLTAFGVACTWWGLRQLERMTLGAE